MTRAGRKTVSDRGPQLQEQAAAEAGPGSEGKRDRKRALAAYRRQLARRRTRRRRLLIGGAVVLVAALGTGGLIYLNLPPSVTVSGAFGAKPVVTIPAISPPGTLQVHQLIHGNGALAAKGDLAIADLTAYSWDGTAHKKISALSTSQPQPLTIGSTIPGLDKSLAGTRAGSRLLIIIPPADGFGTSGNSQLGITGKDTLLLVVDVLGAYHKTAGAHGTPETPTGTGLPTVGTAPPGSAPPIHIPSTPPPTTLQSRILISGTGPTVKKGKILVTQYEGVIWRTGKTFDSSWQRATPAAFPIGAGQVIKGWDQTLVGQRVGSRVLIIVPPADGYGSQGSPSAGIEGTDTLVFVIDILGAY